jgi:hypothetical protein
MLTFEEVLERVSELPIAQQELLIEIVKRRTADNRRKILARESFEALDEFRAGGLKASTAMESIAELRDFLESDADEA